MNRREQYYFEAGKIIGIRDLAMYQIADKDKGDLAVEYISKLEVEAEKELDNLKKYRFKGLRKLEI